MTPDAKGPTKHVGFNTPDGEDGTTGEPRPGKNVEADRRKSLVHQITLKHQETTVSGSEASAPAQPRSVLGKLCGCLRSGKEAPGFHQTLVVLRHSERLDRMDSTYPTTEQGQRWPHDCPITEAGVKLARDVAAEMLALNKKANFTMVASSPYRRCLETAAEVAKVLNLPIVVDQELGEVCDQTMPKEPGSSFRSPKELRDMCQSLGLQTMNPELDDGGLKLFGKPPLWPESLEDAKKRMVVRIETYLEQSALTQQNFVLVTHADAVAAALEMFERGFADISNMDFCARLVAQRTLRSGAEHSELEEQRGVYAEKWDIKFEGVTAQLCKPDDSRGMGQYFEKMHLDNCEETVKISAKRRQKRTQTDAVFDSTLKKAPLKGMGCTISQLRMQDKTEAEDEPAAEDGLPGVVVCDAGETS